MADTELEELELVSDQVMGDAAESAEGGREVTRVNEPNGGQFSPIYSNRRTKCYTVTDSELKQLGLANLGATAFFTIGSLLAGFAIDIFKNAVLGENVPDAAKEIVSAAQPMLFVIAAVFYIFGLFAMLWRKSMIKTIKDESVEIGAAKTETSWRFQWPISRK